MLNTDNAAQLYAQCRLCCSGLCSILTMLLNSMLNADYAAQVYAQYWQCCSTLCSILTMLLRSMLNTGNAAPIYAQYPLCGSTMQKLLILLRIGNVFLIIFTGTSWGANNISWFSRPTPTGHKVFFPRSWHWNHVKNSSSTSQYVRTPAAAWILVLLWALLQNNPTTLQASSSELHLSHCCVIL